MPTATELFGRFSTPADLENALEDGRFIRSTLASDLKRRFADTPIAAALERLVTTQDKEGRAIQVDDFEKELSSQAFCEFGRAGSIWFYDQYGEMDFHVTTRDGEDWNWDYSDRREPVQVVMQAALQVKELVRKTHPDLISSEDLSTDRTVGFDLTLLPEIPEGMYFIKETASDWVIDGYASKGILGYQQWTMVDTRSGAPHEEQLLLWEVSDHRTADGRGFAGEFHTCYTVIPQEMKPLPHDSLRYPLGWLGEGIKGDIPHVFGHLPEELADMQMPKGRR